jgi:hypothetical protein
MTKRIESPLGTNNWHHGNGVLVCGGVRIARADFDTNPSREFQENMFDWICQTLNDGHEKQKLHEHIELYAAEMSEAKEAGFYSASELFDAYKTVSNKIKTWKPIETAPTNLRVMIASDDEMAMGWLDVIDNQWYYAPQGGLVKQWIPTKWQHIPE